MYMSARRTGASGFPREVAFQSQAAAAVASLASSALFSSCCPGWGLEDRTLGGGSRGFAGAVVAGTLFAVVVPGSVFSAGGLWGCGLASWVGGPLSFPGAGGLGGLEGLGGAASG